MAGELLLDTGALISLLDRSQAQHRGFRRFFEAWTGTVVTTEAVLTESSHLLARVRRGRSACVDFVLAGGALLIPTDGNSLRRIRELMNKYEDLPMGYADATLVALAEELRTDRIMTTDRRDFDVYRIGGRRRFRVLP